MLQSQRIVFMKLPYDSRNSVNKMKKIAICFSGHLRNFISVELSEFTEHVRNLTDSGYEVDCFFSIWDTYNTQMARRGNPGNCDNIDLNHIQESFKILNVKALEVESYEDVKHNFYLKNFHPTIEPELPGIMNLDGVLHSTPMFYKIYKCNLLKKNYELEHNIQYDVVVRYRANIKLINLLTMTQIENNTIYNQDPNSTPYTRGLGYTHESLMTHDMFFYGISATMDIICDVYPNLSRIISNHGSTGPERIFYDWCFLENKLKHQTSINQIDYRQ